MIMIQHFFSTEKLKGNYDILSTSWAWNNFYLQLDRELLISTELQSNINYSSSDPLYLNKIAKSTKINQRWAR